MLKQRMIAVLILRNGQVVQSIRFKHTNVIHADPIHAMEAFNKWAVDEIVLLNVSPESASAEQFVEITNRISRECFVPLSVGGWITDPDYAQRLLRSGADKLVVNTILHDNPELVTRLADSYGRQCIVASIDVNKTEDGSAVAVDRGRRVLEHTPAEWARRCVELGAGEIFFNSISHDGARRGYDLENLKSVCAATSVPVIAFGGVMTWEHLAQGLRAGADAVAAANIFHYTEQATRKAKSYLADEGFNVREEGRAFQHAHPDMTNA